MKLNTWLFLKSICTLIAAFAACATLAYSADVALQWDPNDPAPEGYRVFVREEGQAFNYNNPIWEKNLTTCTLTGLVEGTTYHFVVRAYLGDQESVDSEEVSYTPPQVPADTGADSGSDTDTANSGDDGSGSGSTTDTDDGTATDTVTDTDGDSVPDALDQFPYDPEEWADSDGDGIGNNADTADDSTVDSTETAGNQPPDTPVIDAAEASDRVDLTPVLICGGYVDDDNDDHYRSRWQISTESDFSTLILDETSATQLTAYTVGPMVLDVDTVYYWRVRFIDARNGVSEWSATQSFTTIAAELSQDVDFNGVPDEQEVEETVDVNENGIADVLEGTIMSVNTVEGQTVVGVETLSDSVTLVGIKSISSETIADKSVKFGFGLVGFKLHLQDGADTASVNIHFSKRVPKDAKLYKYNVDEGWQEYPHAIFSANRKCVTLVLEDGGVGDEDGVKNGVIVDPSGIAYEEASDTSSDGASLTTGDGSTSTSGPLLGNSCFISAGLGGAGVADGTMAKASIVLTLVLLTVGILSAGWVQLRRRD